MNLTVKASPSLQFPLFFGLGVLFWFVAALFIRFVGSSLFVPGSSALIVLFALTIPVAWAFVLGVTLAGVRGAAILPAVVVMAATAMALDGVALVWFPALYALPAQALALVGAWLLWGVAWCLVVALLMPLRRR